MQDKDNNRKEFINELTIEFSSIVVCDAALILKLNSGDQRIFLDFNKDTDVVLKPGQSNFRFDVVLRSDLIENTEIDIPQSKVLLGHLNRSGTGHIWSRFGVVAEIPLSDLIKEDIL